MASVDCSRCVLFVGYLLARYSGKRRHREIEANAASAWIQK
jgi:hypothetical protein